MRHCHHNESFLSFPGDPLDYFSIFPCVLHHFSEHSLFLDQLQWTSSFCDSPLVHHDDLVVICDGVESVRNGDNCTLFESCTNAFLNKSIGFHVDIRCSFIQNEEPIVPQKGSSQT